MFGKLLGLLPSSLLKGATPYLALAAIAAMLAIGFGVKFWLDGLTNTIKVQSERIVQLEQVNALQRVENEALQSQMRDVVHQMQSLSKLNESMYSSLQSTQSRLRQLELTKNRNEVKSNEEADALLRSFNADFNSVFQLRPKAN